MISFILSKDAILLGTHFMMWAPMVATLNYGVNTMSSTFGY